MFKSTWRKSSARSSNQCAGSKRAAETGERNGFRCVVTVILLAVSPTLLADDADKQELIHFDIPQQRADLALTQFAEQADLTLVFPYDYLRKKTANPLVGDYTVKEGAELLLDGTGYQPKFSRRLVMSIAAVEQPDAEGGLMKHRKKGLFAGIVAAVGSLFGAHGASAQDASGEAARSATLEEIVVTAQKREQSYIDVPVAVSSISGEVLDMAKVTEFQDLVQLSPSLTYNQSGDQRGVGILVRGIGTSNFQTAVEPTVSTVVDGVVMGRTAQFISDLADVERVEILRGPQGTLFGKNASAGLINIITKRPTQEFEGMASASGTDDGGWGLNAILSGPLSDSVRGRIAAYDKQYDGFAKNLYTGHTINGDDSWGVRAKLDINIADSANLLLIADVSAQDRNCCTFFLEDAAGDRFFEWDYEQYGIDVNGNERNDVTLDAEDGFSNTDTYGLSAELNVDFENFLLTSITAYRNFQLESNQGIDGLPYAGPAYGRLIFTSNGAYHGLFKGGNQEQDQFSEELRISTTAWDDVRLTAGLFYWDQTVDRYFERQAYLCVAPPAGDLTLSPDPSLTPCAAALSPGGYFESTADFTNWALFGQAEWDLAERWRLNLGLRYTQDDIAVDFDRVTIPGPTVPASDSGSSSTNESNVSGKVSVQFDATDELMLYASFAKGYKAPAFDLIFGSTAESIQDPVPPETSDAWEAGLKGELFGDRLRLGLTVFHTKFNDLQGQATDPDVLAFRLTSAGVAITQGVELDLTAKPVPNLLINGGISYTDAHFDEYPNGLCWFGQTEAEGCVGGFQDLSGKQIPNAPKWKYSVQGRYDIDLAMPFNMFLSGTWRWQDESPGEPTEWPGSFHDSYGVLDLVVGLEADDGRWSAHYFVKNVLDDFYVDLKTQSPNNVRINHYLSRDAERYMGAEVTFRFGKL